MLFKSSFPVWFMLFVSWLAHISVFSTQDDDEEVVGFDGSSYITYRLSTTKRTRQDRIRLLFRTINSSGLLLHAGGKNGDFMTLELVDGKLRYSGNLGSFGNTSGFHEYFIGNHLADNEWHQLDITRQGKNLLIKVDVTGVAPVLPGLYATLELDDKIYVAGVDQEGEARARKMYQRKLPFTKFEGCLQYIILNREHFATLTKKLDPNITIFGNVSSGCHMNEYLPLGFEKPESHIIISTAPYSDVLSFSFKFRTFDSNGLLIMHQGKKHISTDVLLWLVNGLVKLDVTFRASSSEHVTLRAGKSLNDGAWHSVAVEISGQRVQLKVDGVTFEHKLTPAKTFTNSLQISIGSNSPNIVGFVGCMYDIVVQGREVNPSRERSSHVVIGQCIIDDHCLSNPCKNGGKCFQQLSQAKCNCSSHFSGKYCEIPAIVSRETCADWKASGATQDGPYMISPNDVKPFPVYCKFHDLKEPITVINHVMAGNQTKAVNQHTRKAGFYFHPVQYSADPPSIRALISSSSHCRQHLTYNCLNSLLLDSLHEFDLDGGRGARWISRDGRTMDYWAGARPGSKKCSCGVTNTCYRQDLKCNCDAWDDVWRKDEGYITDMEALPVKNVKFSVRATSSESKFTLGGLECFGRKIMHTTRIPTKQASSSSSSSSLSLSSNHGESTANTKTSIKITPTTTTVTKNNATNVYESPTYGPPIDKPPIVIIESPRKYITIRQNSNQELILIILSVVLAVFILAILILMIRQNLFLTCKCMSGPVYRDVSNIDSIELGPPSSLYTNVDTEIVEYEASPYPPRGMDGVVVNSSRRNSSCRVIHVNVLESDSNDENDRLHLSGGSSPSSDDKEDWNKKNTLEKNEYEDLGSLEMVLLKSPQEMMEVQVEKVKEALYEVISASEVNINNNPITKETNTENTLCVFMHEDEHYNHTSTISSYGMEFSRPPSYQDIEGACSLEQDLGSDSTHAQSTLSSGSSSWDSENILEHDDITTDYEPNEISSSSNDLIPVNNNFPISNTNSSSSDALSDDDVEISQNIDYSTSLSNGQASVDAHMAPLNEISKRHSYIVCEDRSESEPLLEGNLPSSPSSMNGIESDLNLITNINDYSAKDYSDVFDDLTAHAQPKQTSADQKNSDSRGECFRHETSL